MNERIRELAEQVGCTIDGMGYGEGNVEKFAELIVRECVELALNMAQSYREANEQDGTDDAATYTFGGVIALKKHANELLNHFGVEE